MQKMDEKISGRVNVAEFMKFLMSTYGKTFSDRYPDAVTSEGVSYAWSNSIAQYSRAIAKLVSDRILDDKTEYSKFPPNPVQLKRLFENEISLLNRERDAVRNQVNLERSLADKQGKKNEELERWQDKVNPLWREESRAIREKKGVSCWLSWHAKLATAARIAQRESENKDEYRAMNRAAKMGEDV